MIATRERTLSIPATAFDRIGGFDILAQAVGRFIARMGEVPALAPLAASAAREDARWRFQLLLNEILGGPMAYEGPDPVELRATIGLDGVGFDAAVRLLTTCCIEVGAPATAVEELRGLLASFRRRVGLEGPARVSSFGDLVDRAETLVAERRLDGCNLFVLDAHYTVVYASPEAMRSAQGVDSDLRRAFGLGADDIQGNSLLRFHPAPTQLQGLLTDLSGQARETTWSFGRTTWRAHIIAIVDLAGQHRGFAVPWRDETETTRVTEIFRRLRAEAEELPIPLMYPDFSRETWYGNAACEVALERLKPYLPFPVNPLEGIPARLFFPDQAERRALFRTPERLPHKVQLQFGPDTVSVLVSAVLDQEQRYMGPQITWEIVYFTPSVTVPAVEPIALVAAEPAPVVDGPAAPVAAVELTTTARLQEGARVLAQVGSELQQLAALVESVASLSSQASPDAPSAETLPGADQIARQVSAAAEALTLARQGTKGSRPEVQQALDLLNTLARQSSLLAVESAADVLREDAEIAASSLSSALQELSGNLRDRVAGAMAIAGTTADALNAASHRSNQLRALRATLLEGPVAGG